MVDSYLIWQNTNGSFQLLHVHVQRAFACITELPHEVLCSALTPPECEHDKQTVREFHRQPAAAPSHQTLVCSLSGNIATAHIQNVPHSHVCFGPDSLALLQLFSLICVLKSKHSWLLSQLKLGLLFSRGRLSDLTLTFLFSCSHFSHKTTRLLEQAGTKGVTIDTRNAQKMYMILDKSCFGFLDLCYIKSNPIISIVNI